MTLIKDEQWESASPFVVLVAIPWATSVCPVASFDDEQLDVDGAHDAPRITNGHSCLRHPIAHRLRRTVLRRHISDARQNQVVPSPARQNRQVHLFFLREFREA